MLKYIIRLDDACPNMKSELWDKMEALLDKYNIKPIVGIIPDCKDEEFLTYGSIKNFWKDYALKWQEKNWVIALHGLNHKLNKIVRTEFSGKSYDDQKAILSQGYEILKKHNVNPVCFFAPAHTFDENTIEACYDLKKFRFISDGVSLYPYKHNKMLFLPSIFDTPHKILPFGVYTFVYHPNNMTEADFKYLEGFIIKHKEEFDADLDYILNKYSKRKRSILDYIILLLINLYRKIRGNKE